MIYVVILLVLTGAEVFGGILWMQVYGGIREVKTRGSIMFGTVILSSLTFIVLFYVIERYIPYAAGPYVMGLFVSLMILLKHSESKYKYNNIAAYILTFLIVSAMTLTAFARAIPEGDYSTKYVKIKDNASGEEYIAYLLVNINYDNYKIKYCVNGIVNAEERNVIETHSEYTNISEPCEFSFNREEGKIYQTTVLSTDLQPTLYKRFMVNPIVLTMLIIFAGISALLSIASIYKYIKNPLASVSA